MLRVCSKSQVYFIYILFVSEDKKTSHQKYYLYWMVTFNPHCFSNSSLKLGLMLTAPIAPPRHPHAPDTANGNITRGCS